MTGVNRYKLIIIANVKLLLLVLIMVTVTSVALTSCNKDEGFTGLGSKNIKVQIYATNLSLTRQTSSESQITEVQALVFIDNGGGAGYKYSYTASVTSLTNVGLSATFDIEIYTEARPVNIYIVANSNDAITNNMPMVGDTEYEVKQKLIESVTSANISGNFPMWGEYILPTGISSSLNNNVVHLNVLRAIARIDINISDSPDVFTMTSVQAFRVNNQLQVVPNTYTGTLLVSDPSIPIGTSSTVNTTPIPVIGNISEAQLYLPESEAPAVANQVSDATCVIAGGRYNGSGTITYYRLDFAPDIAGYPLGQILRNHHYTFNVLKVTGAGWPTPEEAAENIQTNIEVGVQDWSDVNTNVSWDNTDYFRLSTRNITVAGTVGSYGYTFVSTSVSDYSIQWSDASGNPLGAPAATIDDGILSITKTNYIIRINAIADNPSTEDYTRYVLIVAKRAQIVIAITHLGV